MATQIAALIRQAEAAATSGASDGAQVRVLSAPVPADPDAAETGTLLAQFTLGTPAYGAPSDDGTTASVTANAIGTVNALTNGTAAYYRQTAAGDPGIVHLQGTVTVTGGGGDMQFDDINFTAGEPLTVSSYVYQRPQE